MKNITIFLVIVAVVVLFVYFYVLSPKSSECEEGELVTWPSDENFRCVNGEWEAEEKTEIEKAIQAKKDKSHLEALIAEKEKFCGKENVSVYHDGYHNFELYCKDYSLVPDENLQPKTRE